MLDAYLHLIPGTYKADFFRYCHLYIHGGVYHDCKHVCVQSYEKVIERDYDMMMAEDIGPQIYSTSFLFAVPGLEMFKTMIDLLVHNIQSKYFGPNSLYPTGPGALYIGLHPYVVEGKYNIHFMKLEYLTNEIKEYGGTYSHNEIGVLAYVRYPGYYKENNYRKTTYYNILWNNG